MVFIVFSRKGMNYILFVDSHHPYIKELQRKPERDF